MGADTVGVGVLGTTGEGTTGIVWVCCGGSCVGAGVGIPVEVLVIDPEETGGAVVGEAEPGTAGLVDVAAGDADSVDDGEGTEDVGDAGSGAGALVGPSAGVSVTGAGDAVSGHFGPVDEGDDSAADEDDEGETGAGTGEVVADGEVVAGQDGDVGAGTDGLVDDGAGPCGAGDADGDPGAEEDAEGDGETGTGELVVVAAGVCGTGAGDVAVESGAVVLEGACGAGTPGWIVTVTISLLTSGAATGSFVVWLGFAVAVGEVLMVIRTSTIWPDEGASLIASASCSRSLPVPMGWSTGWSSVACAGPPPRTANAAADVVASAPHASVFMGSPIYFGGRTETVPVWSLVKAPSGVTTSGISSRMSRTPRGIVGPATTLWPWKTPTTRS